MHYGSKEVHRGSGKRLSDSEGTCEAQAYQKREHESTGRYGDGAQEEVQALMWDVCLLLLLLGPVAAWAIVMSAGVEVLIYVRARKQWRSEQWERRRIGRDAMYYRLKWKLQHGSKL